MFLASCYNHSSLPKHVAVGLFHHSDIGSRDPSSIIDHPSSIIDHLSSITHVSTVNPSPASYEHIIVASDINLSVYSLPLPDDDSIPHLLFQQPCFGRIAAIATWRNLDCYLTQSSSFIEDSSSIIHHSSSVIHHPSYLILLSSLGILHTLYLDSYCMRFRNICPPLSLAMHRPATSVLSHHYNNDRYIHLTVHPQSKALMVADTVGCLTVFLSNNYCQQCELTNSGPTETQRGPLFAELPVFDWTRSVDFTLPASGVIVCSTFLESDVWHCQQCQRKPLCRTAQKTLTPDQQSLASSTDIFLCIVYYPSRQSSLSTSFIILRINTQSLSIHQTSMTVPSSMYRSPSTPTHSSRLLPSPTLFLSSTSSFLPSSITHFIIHPSHPSISIIITSSSLIIFSFHLEDTSPSPLIGDCIVNSTRSLVWIDTTIPEASQSYITSYCWFAEELLMLVNEHGCLFMVTLSVSDTVQVMIEEIDWDVNSCSNLSPLLQEIHSIIPLSSSVFLFISTSVEWSIVSILPLSNTSRAMVSSTFIAAIVTSIPTTGVILSTNLCHSHTSRLHHAPHTSSIVTPSLFTSNQRRDTCVDYNSADLLLIADTTVTSVRRAVTMTRVIFNGDQSEHQSGDHSEDHITFSNIQKLWILRGNYREKTGLVSDTEHLVVTFAGHTRVTRLIDGEDVTALTEFDWDVSTVTASHWIGPHLSLTDVEDRRLYHWYVQVTAKKVTIYTGRLPCNDHSDISGDALMTTDGVNSQSCPSPSSPLTIDRDNVWMRVEDCVFHDGVITLSHFITMNNENQSSNISNLNLPILVIVQNNRRLSLLKCPTSTATKTPSSLVLLGDSLLWSLDITCIFLYQSSSIIEHSSSIIHNPNLLLYISDHYNLSILNSALTPLYIINLSVIAHQVMMSMRSMPDIPDPDNAVSISNLSDLSDMIPHSLFVTQTTIVMGMRDGHLLIFHKDTSLLSSSIVYSLYHHQKIGECPVTVTNGWYNGCWIIVTNTCYILIGHSYASSIPRHYYVYSIKAPDSHQPRIYMNDVIAVSALSSSPASRFRQEGSLVLVTPLTMIIIEVQLPIMDSPLLMSPVIINQYQSCSCHRHLVNVTASISRQQLSQSVSILQNTHSITLITLDDTSNIPTSLGHSHAQLDFGRLYSMTIWNLCYAGGSGERCSDNVLVVGGENKVYMVEVTAEGGLLLQGDISVYPGEPVHDRNSAYIENVIEILPVWLSTTRHTDDKMNDGDVGDNDRTKDCFDDGRWLNVIATSTSLAVLDYEKTNTTPIIAPHVRSNDFTCSLSHQIFTKLHISCMCNLWSDTCNDQVFMVIGTQRDGLVLISCSLTPFRSMLGGEPVKTSHPPSSTTSTNVARNTNGRPVMGSNFTVNNSNTDVFNFSAGDGSSKSYVSVAAVCSCRHPSSIDSTTVIALDTTGVIIMFSVVSSKQFSNFSLVPTSVFQTQEIARSINIIDPMTSRWNGRTSCMVVSSVSGNIWSILSLTSIEATIVQRWWIMIDSYQCHSSSFLSLANIKSWHSSPKFIGEKTGVVDGCALMELLRTCYWDLTRQMTTVSASSSLSDTLASWTTLLTVTDAAMEALIALLDTWDTECQRQTLHTSYETCLSFFPSSSPSAMLRYVVGRTLDMLCHVIGRGL